MIIIKDTLMKWVANSRELPMRFLLAMLIMSALFCTSKNDSKEKRSIPETTQKSNVHGGTQRDASPPNNVVQTISAKILPQDPAKKKVAYNTYQFAAFGRKLTFTSQGNLRIKESKNRYQSISLFKDSSLFLEAVEFVPYKNGLVIMYQLNDAGVGWSEIVRVSIPQTKVLWRTKFGNINLTPAIIENQFLYGTTLGFVGKVDLETGKILWHKPDLWEKHQVNSFYKMGIIKDTVVFIGKVYKRENDNRMTTKNLVLRYNKNTGVEL